MAPPVWVHCNKCCILYKESIKFFISNCGHVVCENCVNLMGSRRCVVCKTQTSVTPLKDLSPRMLEYFEPFNIPLDNVNKIVKFQMKNLNMILEATLSKYSSAKASLMKASKAMDYLKAENSKLKSILMAKREVPNVFNNPPGMKMYKDPRKQNNSLNESMNMYFDEYGEPRMLYKKNRMMRNNVVPTHSRSTESMPFGNFKPYGI